MGGGERKGGKKGGEGKREKKGEKEEKRRRKERKGAFVTIFIYSWLSDEKSAFLRFILVLWTTAGGIRTGDLGNISILSKQPTFAQEVLFPSRKWKNRNTLVKEINKPIYINRKTILV